MPIQEPIVLKLTLEQAKAIAVAASVCDVMMSSTDVADRATVARMQEVVGLIEREVL